MIETGNSDMHLKNFSLINFKQSFYTLSPAYDLVPTALLLSKKEDPEEVALSLNGKKLNLKLKNFKKLGQNLLILEKTVDHTIGRFLNGLPKMETLIQKSILSEKNKKKYQTLLIQQGLKLQ